MQSYYEINIHLNGRHFFATAERSCVTKEQADTVSKVLAQKFPASEGYGISCTYWKCGGSSVEIKN